MFSLSNCFVFYGRSKIEKYYVCDIIAKHRKTNIAESCCLETT